jgi:hypothetical protein
MLGAVDAAFTRQPAAMINACLLIRPSSQIPLVLAMADDAVPKSLRPTGWIWYDLSCYGP